ncbi:M16 family metallopeptidase [Poriferisphaera sp. WC338]|uniref:M16 family metallopeptidase n=1 Tax=Poriferisphaera sp. WC338 TaxID=3425129 RepID=UPI003D8198E3
MSIQFKQHTLPNGLTIIAEPNPDAHTAAVGYFVKAGTRDEDHALMGVSHFLEHMMFKGTTRRTADDVNREFDDMGANYNAFTSHEMTVYFAHVLPEFLPAAVDLLGDILRPALRDEDFDMEKNVIIEEIGMYDDRPSWRLQDQLLEEFFGVHPLSYRVLGTVQSVTDLTATQMRDYFEQRYSPDNIVVSAAGRLDFDRLVDDVAKITEDWKPTGARRVYKDPIFELSNRKIEDERTSRHYIGLMCPGPSAQDMDRYPAKVLADILGDSDGSRIYWSLVDPGHADEADMSILPYDQTGSFFAYASCDPEKGDQVQAILEEVLDEAGEGLTGGELERAKNKLATAATLQGERPAGRMQGLGGQWLYQGEYTPLSEELARLMAVTREDIVRVIEKYRFAPRTILSLTPPRGA